MAFQTTMTGKPKPKTLAELQREKMIKSFPGVSQPSSIPTASETVAGVAQAPVTRPSIWSEGPRNLKPTTIKQEPVSVIGTEPKKDIITTITPVPQSSLYTAPKGEVKTSYWEPVKETVSTIPKKEVFEEPITKEVVKPETPVLKTPTAEGYQSALDIISKGMKGEASPGLQAGILGGREALATAVRGREAQAGALAAKTGALGQGTAGGYAEAVRAGAIKDIAGQEVEFAKLRGAEQKEYVDKMIAAERAEKGEALELERVKLSERGQNISIEQLNRQYSGMAADLREKIASRMQQGEQFDLTRLDEIDRFSRTMSLTEKQWNDKFGLDKSQIYMNNLLELSVNNPVLAEKLQDYMLKGGQGAVGGFTAAEQTKIQELADKARLREGKIDNIFDLILDNLKKQLTGYTGVETTETTETTEAGPVKYKGKDISKLTDEDWMKDLSKNDTALDNLVKKGEIIDWREGPQDEQVFKPGYIDNLKFRNSASDSGKQKKSLVATPGQRGSIVLIQGTPYELLNYDSAKEYVTFGKDKRQTRIYARNLESGEPEYIYDKKANADD